MSELPHSLGSPAVCYQIGDQFLLNTHTNRLTRKDKVIELEDRLVLLLVYFIQHTGEVLHKEVLLKTIWQGKVVNEDSVAVAVSSPSYIKTIQGKGYQFIGVAKPLDPTGNHALSPSMVKKAEWSKSYLFLSAFISSFILLLAVAYGINKTTSKTSPVEPSTTLGGENWQKDFQAANKLIQESDPASLRLAIKQLRASLDTYGESAQVYIAIAEAKVRLLGEKVTLKENCVEVIDLAQKALSLEPELPAAHKLTANMAFWCKRDQAYAEKHYLEAIKLNPKDDSVLMNYAQLLLAQKRFEESLSLVEQARKLNPVNYSVPNVVWIYQMQGRDDLAQRELNRILTTEPDDRYYHISAKRIYERMGDNTKAFEQWLWLMREQGFSELELDQVQAAYQQGGLSGVNGWLLAQKTKADLGDYAPPLAWARYALSANAKDVALDYLEAAFERRQSALLWAGVDPAYDSVRNTPRFQNILARIAEVENY